MACILATLYKYRHMYVKKKYYLNYLDRGTERDLANQSQNYIGDFGVKAKKCTVQPEVVFEQNPAIHMS